MDWRCLEVNANFGHSSIELALLVVSLGVGVNSFPNADRVRACGFGHCHPESGSQRDPFESKIEPTATHPHLRTSGGPFALLGLLLTVPSFQWTRSSAVLWAIGLTFRPKYPAGLPVLKNLFSLCLLHLKNLPVPESVITARQLTRPSCPLNTPSH